MAVIYPIPALAQDYLTKANETVKNLLGNALDPYKASEPPTFPFGANEKPQGLIPMMANQIIPPDIKDAFMAGLLNLMPGYIAANYRSPEAIQGLRKLMAQENQARGPMSLGGYAQATDLNPSVFGLEQKMASQYKGPEVLAEIRERGSSPTTGGWYPGMGENPDPLDQILRGSWFHGMRREARQQAPYTVPPHYTDIIPWESFGKSSNPEAQQYALDLFNKIRDMKGISQSEWDLLQASERGLPASTHATPSYTRFGEPYGVSITASPSIARNFSADDYIHRVMPLYGGPPTERIIPMWRPEGQAAMNEGYNAAFNQVLDVPELANSIRYHSRNMAKHPDLYAEKQPINEWIVDALGMQDKANAAQFNTLYSKALQDQGYRGILYSPQRYGEYEMLMLDPSYVKPLDYRKLGEYTQGLGARGQQLVENFAGQGHPGWLEGVGGTPGAVRGYAAAQPEFATGATRLSDVFNQQSWVDRINDENKRRILELISPLYREQVGNQLMGNM